jgi:hypothetical protein
VEGIGETRQEVELMKKAKIIGGELHEKRVIIKPEKVCTCLFFCGVFV